MDMVGEETEMRSMSNASFPGVGNWVILEEVYSGIHEVCVEKGDAT